MAAFARNVLDLLEPLVLNHGFKPSRATATATFCAFAKRVSEQICYYLYVRDDRAGQGDVAVDLWVAPIDFPDDRLDTLGIGYRIRVGVTQEPSDEFFRAIAQRLGPVLPGLKGLAEAVHSELLQPLLPGKRISSYLLERRIWARVRDSRSATVSQRREVLEKAAERMAAGQATMDALELCAASLAQAVLAHGALLDEPDLRFLDGDQALLADVLASQVYIEALAPLVTTASRAG